MIGIEMRKRLVEEDELRVSNERATDGDALLGTTGQNFDVEIGERPKMQEIEYVGDPRLGVGRGSTTNLQREGDVAAHRHARVERIVFKNHGDVALARRKTGDGLVVKKDLACGGTFNTSCHLERGALSAAGGAEQG